jgi:glucosamine 6-phosphate synthetase-like amidotransferase/phosphosugar isomerase protein
MTAILPPPTFRLYCLYTEHIHPRRRRIVILSRDSVTVYNTEKEIVPKEVFNVDWDVHAAEKGGHEHFMFKEIMEQPKAIRDTISTRIKRRQNKS